MFHRSKRLEWIDYLESRVKTAHCLTRVIMIIRVNPMQFFPQYLHCLRRPHRDI